MRDNIKRGRRTGNAGTVLIAVLTGTLAACDGSASHDRQKSQVVAKVNSREITISQLNDKLQNTPPASITPAVTRQAVDALIDEELLVQDALKNKLDRDPGVVQGLEQARRQILARTYMERMIFPSTPVTITEQERYYKQSPDLFENRKLYKLTIFTLAGADMSDALKKDLNQAHSEDQVRALLEKQEIKFETQVLNSAAEQLPTEKLPQFAKSAVGDVLIANQNDGKALLIAVNAIEASPLSFERARPMIEQYLTTTRNTQAVRDQLKHEKAVAKISYVDAEQSYAKQ